MLLNYLIIFFKFQGIFFEMNAATLQLQISNIKTIEGNIQIAIYDTASNFLEVSKALRLLVVPVKSISDLTLEVSDLEPGDYAIAVFHDLNQNGYLDTNWAGIPTEPYAFSNNVRPKFRASRWSESKFHLNSGINQHRLYLKTW